MTLLTLPTYVWTIRLSCLAASNLCNRFRPQVRAFRVWTTQRFRQLRQHISRHFPRPASREHDGSATQPECVELRPADSETQPESVELRPDPRSARVLVVERQVAETQSLN